MGSHNTIINLLSFALVAPLVSSLLAILLTRRVMFKAAGVFTTLVMLAACIASWYAGFLWMGDKPAAPLVCNIPWIPLHGMAAGYLYLGVMVDGLTIAMMCMVTLISTLVHLYSIGYMNGDKRYNRFFAYLSLFSFSMLGIVLANSIMMLFVFWELVGLTSYLLIGFWFEKRGPQLACKKAFVMNRIGDMGFLVGFGILFYQLGGRLLLPATGGQPANMFASLLDVLMKQDPNFSISNPPLWLTAAGIGLFFGAIGKSAQFPLHTWLPDAMEGPTPVSSIVHSATMVAAGVYLTARIYPILTPGAHLFIATIGLITLVIAACMALVMHDIKRVLAYSTLSQLGYMILGLGAGAWSFALFHLITHAFFKCCLFQCSGSVIHAAHHQQDMRYYGGLGRKMPITFACFAICTLAIAGASIPYTDIGISGFYSKDGIIAGTVNYGNALGGLFGPISKLYFWGPTAVAYLTVFYMTRSLALTFLGKPRDQHLYDNAHEAPWQMWLPQVVLAVMAIAAAPILMPMWLSNINHTHDAMVNSGVTWVQPGVAEELGQGMHYAHAKLLHGLSWIIMIAAGLVLFATEGGKKAVAAFVKLPGVGLIHNWFYNKFYFDALYDVFAVGLGKTIALICAALDKHVIDGVVNLTGFVTKIAASLTGRFDNRVVDGAVNGAATAARSGGDMLRSTQPGRIRVYVLGAFASACFVVLAVLVVVIVSR
ncbi:MAG: NADH-quinone oxidoreductase subunit L [Planctomycetes bacterium]|nr:NADH-quinone oxidoreductase subunit L [Planctomycetota bacterium]